MTLTLSKEELVTLLQLACIGDWIKNASFMGEEASNIALMNDKRVIQKLLLAAHEGQLDTLVEFDSDDQEYVETIALEDMFLPHIEAYDEENFWPTLASKLAGRDLLAEYGEGGLARMDERERFTKMRELADWYEAHFNKEGLSHLRVDPRNPKGMI